MSINLLAVTFSCCRRLTGVSSAWAQSLAQGPSKSSQERELARRQDVALQLCLLNLARQILLPSPTR